MRQRGRYHAFTCIVAVFLSASASWNISAQSLPVPPARAYGRALFVAFSSGGRAVYCFNSLRSHFEGYGA
jgi:hypothetical protein